MATMTVKEVMTSDLVTCQAHTSIEEAARLMRDHDIGDVLVCTGERLDGIVTDRDLVVRCLAGGADLRSARVGDVCSGGVVSVSPDTTVDDAARAMRERAVRRLPVVDDGRPVGIVSLGDLAVGRGADSVLADISAAAPNG